MKIIALILLSLSNTLYASIVGITPHALSDEARVLTAEMAAYMSQRREMGMGLRYTHGITPGRLLDITVGSGQNSRGFYFGGGMDFELLHDEGNQPRISIKPFYQHQRFDSNNLSVVGAAPTLRKGLNILEQDFYPYLAFPSGIQVDSSDDSFKYFGSLTLGATAPLPVASGKELMAGFEASKDLGASSDYLSASISWIWN